MIICQTHNHNYPHQVDGNVPCPKCEAETQQELAMDQESGVSDEQKLKKKIVKNRKNGSF